jgi:hypothetical protein
VKNLNRTPAPSPDLTDEDVHHPEAPPAQTSLKRGLKSDAQKKAASRPEYGSSPGAKPKPGAHGDATHYPARSSANRLDDDPPPPEDPMDPDPILQEEADRQEE